MKSAFLSFVLLALCATFAGGCVYRTEENFPMADRQFNVSANAPSKQGHLFIGDTSTTVQMQAEFLAAEYLTVQFDVIPPESTGPSLGIYDTVADVAFTVQGGGTVRRTLSIGSGTTISGPGQNCTVTMRDQSNPVIGGGSEYTVMAQVAPGSHPTSASPPTLRGFPSVVPIAPLGFIFLKIPPDAGVTSAQVYVVNATNTNRVTAVAVQGNDLGVHLKEYDPNTQPGFVTITPGSTAVLIFNLSAAETYDAQITWGIDG